MAEIICHDNGVYNLYNTISDGFRFTQGISSEHLRELIKEEKGSAGLKTLEGRLERAHEFGHSSYEGGDLDSFLCCNRAGKNEEKLTTEQCIKQFLS